MALVDKGVLALAFRRVPLFFVFYVMFLVPRI